MPDSVPSPAERRRFPNRVYGVGEEPDPRFTLANERTFLAWIRTALALIAGGVALEALGLPLHPELRFTAALLLLVVGTGVPVLAWLMWARTERAMRLGAPLPTTVVGITVAAALCLVGLLLILGFLLR